MFKNKTVCSMLTGAAVGFGLGVLYAPKSGKETRKELMEKKDEVMDKIRNMDFDEEKEKFDKMIKELEEDLLDIDAEDVIEMAKKKARKIKKKANELLELAKEIGDDFLTDAANDIRERAIEITKNVLEKLEEA